MIFYYIHKFMVLMSLLFNFFKINRHIKKIQRIKSCLIWN